MIQGLGIDLVETSRIKGKIDQTKFISRILTTAEATRFKNLTEKRKIEFLAGRFAAKEAYAKALGTGIGAQLSFLDIEILNNESGKPVLTDLQRPGQLVHVAITHTSTAASAVAIIESNVD